MILPFVFNHPIIEQNSLTFWLVGLFICLVVGLFHLLGYSPIKLSEEVKTQVEKLGEIKYIIAPNHLHHLFLLDWKLYYPDAVCYGTDEVIQKRADIKFNYSLNKNKSRLGQSTLSRCYLQAMILIGVSEL